MDRATRHLRFVISILYNNFATKIFDKITHILVIYLRTNILASKFYNIALNDKGEKYGNSKFNK